MQITLLLLCFSADYCVVFVTMTEHITDKETVLDHPVPRDLVSEEEQEPLDSG